MKPPTSPRPAVDVDARMRALVGQAVEPPPSDYARALRERMLDAIDAQRARLQDRSPAASRGRRIAVRVAAVSCAAAVLAVLSGVGIGSWRAQRASQDVAAIVGVEGEVQIVHDGAVRAFSERPSPGLSDGDELRTGDGAGASATLGDGATVQIGSSARVAFHRSGGHAKDPRHDRIDLSAGRVALSVPKLAPGDELTVRTDDALVVVHGTRFSVERATSPGAPPVTRVTVSEGRVAVVSGGRERILLAGEALVVPEPPSASNAPDPQPLPGAASSAATPPETTASTLAKENALLAGAMVQRAYHHEARALALIDELLRTHPSSPLVETASVDRLRLLEDTGNLTRLRKEAERYLADYPRGFARAEVTRMLATTPAPAP